MKKKIKDLSEKEFDRYANKKCNILHCDLCQLHYFDCDYTILKEVLSLIDEEIEVDDE